MSDLIIRPGTSADMPAVLNMVRELAVYEKEPEAVKTTLADYQHDHGSLFYTLLAEQNSRIIGLALYFLTFSTWKGRTLWLEDLIVTEDHRHQGTGKRLFEAVYAEALTRGVTQIKWQVLDWNTPAIRFYEKYPIHIDKGWWNVRMPVK